MRKTRRHRPCRSDTVTTAASCRDAPPESRHQERADPIGGRDTAQGPGLSKCQWHEEELSGEKGTEDAETTVIAVSDRRLDPEKPHACEGRWGREGAGAFCRRQAGPQAHQPPGVTSQDATTFPGPRTEKMCPWSITGVHCTALFTPTLLCAEQFQKQKVGGKLMKKTMPLETGPSRTSYFTVKDPGDKLQ